MVNEVDGQWCLVGLVFVFIYFFDIARFLGRNIVLLPTF